MTEERSAPGSEEQAQVQPPTEAAPAPEPAPAPQVASDQPSAPAPKPKPKRKPEPKPGGEAAPAGDVIEAAATPRLVKRDRARSRRVLAALFWLLASISVLVGGVAVWAHQSLLTAGGWGGIIEGAISDEAVTDAVSVVLVDRLSDSLGVQQLVADALPGPELIANAVTGIAQERITEAVARFAQTDAFQEAFVNVNKAAHDAAMRAIRGGDSEALTSDGGVIAINIFPLIEGVLNSLQDAGIISADRQIPDLTSFQPSDTAVAAIEQVLGREIPDDAGTIVLIDAENLGTVQTVIRWFDSITGLALVLWVLFTGLALWLARSRVRMVLWLSGGAIAALLAARFLTRLLLEGLSRRQPELEARVLVSAIIDAAVDSLLWFTFVLMALAAIVAIGAYVYERRAGLQRPSMETPLRTLGRWVKEHAMVILGVGLGLIAVAVLWSIGGPGIAMLTAAAMLLLVIAVKVLSDESDDAPRTASGG